MKTNHNPLDQGRSELGFPATQSHQKMIFILTLLPLLGLPFFGFNSLGTAVLATPILYKLAYLLMSCIQLGIALIAVRRAGCHPSTLALGPLSLRWSTENFIVRTHRDGRHGAKLFPVSLPGRHDEAPKGMAAVDRSWPLGSLLVAGISILLLVLTLVADAGPLPFWAVVLLTMESIFGAIRGAIHLGKIESQIESEPKRTMILTADAINRQIMTGQRPATWPVQRLTDIADGPLPTIGTDAGWNGLAYFALLDRGEIALAGDRIDAAARSAVEAMRTGKHTVESFVGIFCEMAFFTAFFRDDAECAQSWLNLGRNAWVDPHQRRRAEAAVHYANGDLVTARTLAEQVVRDLAGRMMFGDNRAERDWASAIVRACDNTAHPVKLARSTQAAAPAPPVIVNGHTGQLAARLLPWIFCFAGLIVLAFLASMTRENLAFWILPLGTASFILLFAGLLMGLLFANSWIEVNETGVTYVIHRRPHSFEWYRFRGFGRVTRIPFSASGLVFEKKQKLEKMKGPFKTIGGVPFSTFAPHWRDGQAAAMIQRHAPHLLVTKVSAPR